jgi:enoyl-CoA hydratase/carnithine racemase
MMHEVVEATRHDAVLEIRLNRPEKKNALTIEMYRRLTDVLSAAQTDDAIRVILLGGTADCFTSGNDLQDFLHSPPTGESNPIMQFLRSISSADKPIVAAVAGAAVGVGTTLLLHCDLVYAAQNARFQLPFVDLGLIPEAASSLLLPRLAGHQRAAELLLLGRPFDAETAREIGLVNSVVSPDELEHFTRETARQLAGRSPEAVRLTKRLLKQATRDAVDKRMAEEAELFVGRLQSAETRGAMQAFLSRRKDQR